MNADRHRRAYWGERGSTSLHIGITERDFRRHVAWCCCAIRRGASGENRHRASTAHSSVSVNRFRKRECHLVCSGHRAPVLSEVRTLHTSGVIEDLDVGGWKAHPSFNVEENNALIRARIRTRRDRKPRLEDTYQTRDKLTHLHLIDAERVIVAERVGFEPTCRLPDKTLSRRPRYDHFGTSPVVCARVGPAKAGDYVRRTGPAEAGHYVPQKLYLPVARR